MVNVMTTDPLSVAWVAGIVDGEGWVGMNGGFGRSRANGGHSPAIRVTNTEMEIVQGIMSVVGLGRIYYRSRDKKHPEWKSAYEWRVTGASALQVMCDILPMMRSPTKISAIKVLFCYYIGYWSSAKARRWTENLGVSKRNGIDITSLLMEMNKLLSVEIIP